MDVQIDSKQKTNKNPQNLNSIGINQMKQGTKLSGEKVSHFGSHERYLKCTDLLSNVFVALLFDTFYQFFIVFGKLAIESSDLLEVDLHGLDVLLLTTGLVHKTKIQGKNYRKRQRQQTRSKTLIESIQIDNIMQFSMIHQQLILLITLQFTKMQSDEPAWIKTQIMLQMLQHTTQQFKNQTYDINKVVRQVVDNIKDDHRGNTHQQVVTFAHLLGSVPKYFVELLDTEIITSQTHIITLNSQNWEVARRLYSDFATLTKIPAPERTHEDPKLHQATLNFINMVAKRVASIYQKLANSIRIKMQKLMKTVKTSRMMNNFLLFKILRQFSQQIRHDTIETCIQSVFRYCQLEIIEEFYRYTINKFETVKLFANMDIKDQLFEPNPMIILSSLEKNHRIQILLKQAVSQTGRYAIFVNPQSNHPQLKKSLDDYLLYIEPGQNFRLINCKTVRKNWYIIGDLHNNFKLDDQARQYLIQGQCKVDNKRKGNTEEIDKLFECIPLENVTNLDGVIGRCLLMMKKYTEAADFFHDLSKRAVLAKSIEEIMHTFPIVGFLMAAGSFGRAFYQIFSNKFSTDSKKLTQITGFTIKTGATIGTSILGAFIGQALIPVPVVGALVGTVVGGFLGERGCREVTSMINSVNFENMIDYLGRTIIEHNHWEPTDQFYDLLDIKKKTFESYIPKHMEKEHFITIIGFVLVCFHESTRLTKHNNEKSEKQQKDENEKKKNEKHKNKNLTQYQKQKQFEDDVKKLNQYEGFETQFDLNLIIEYLQKNNAKIYEHYEVIEKSIVPFLAQIMP